MPSMFWKINKSWFKIIGENMPWNPSKFIQIDNISIVMHRIGRQSFQKHINFEPTYSLKLIQTLNHKCFLDVSNKYPITTKN
jgi:hypothetical protein